MNDDESLALPSMTHIHGKKRIRKRHLGWVGMIDKLVGKQDVVVHAVGQKNSERNHKDELPEMKLTRSLLYEQQVSKLFFIKRMWWAFTEGMCVCVCYGKQVDLFILTPAQRFPPEAYKWIRSSDEDYRLKKIKLKKISNLLLTITIMNEK